MNRNLSTRTDDYLAAIEHICEVEAVERASTTAIAKQLGLTMGTVSLTLKKLAGRGLVDLIPHHGVTLTPSGRRVARRVLRRVQRLSEFLCMSLNFTEETANSEGWQLESCVSKKLMTRIGAFLDGTR